jgi:hypothetical protein
MMLHRSNVGPRFEECVNAFTTGIGNGPGATLESLTERSAQAYDRYYAPFFAQHPYILENYLINTILRLRFPFGKEDAQAGKPLSMARECALLTAQFALMKGFLIGVAGFHREAFSAAQVVHTVQATSKHFEHHPEFLNLAYELLMESRMDGARGMAILLRNEEPKLPAAPEIHPPAPEIHPPAPRERFTLGHIRGSVLGHITAFYLLVLSIFPIARTVPMGRELVAPASRPAVAWTSWSTPHSTPSVKMLYPSERGSCADPSKWLVVL